MSNQIDNIKLRISNLYRKKRFQSALKRLMDDPDFQVFWARMLSDCNYLSPVFYEDTHRTAFNEGRRHLAASYMKILTDDDPLIEVMELTKAKETLEKEEKYVSY